MKEIIPYLGPVLAIVFGLVTVFRDRSAQTRWFAFAMVCASIAAVLTLVHQQPTQLSMRILLGVAALICGISGGVQIERSRSATRRDSRVST